MLVISRKPGESVHIGGATVHVQQDRGGTIRLAIDAPKQIPIRRSELPPRPVTPDITFSELCEAMVEPGLRDDNLRLNGLLWCAVERLGLIYQAMLENADKAYCVGCEEVFPRDEVVEHIRHCPDHPLHKKTA